MVENSQVHIQKFQVDDGSEEPEGSNFGNELYGKVHLQNYFHYIFLYHTFRKKLFRHLNGIHIQELGICLFWVNIKLVVMYINVLYQGIRFTTHSVLAEH